MRAKPEHHTVTVRTITEDDWTTIEAVEFGCCAPEDAPCRTYPVCECEVWYEDEDRPGHDTEGHPFVTGQDCWVAGWFDNAARWEEPRYVGSDRSDDTDSGIPPISQHGHVSIVDFEEDIGPRWCWHGMPVRDDEQAETDPTRAPVVHVPGQEAFDFGEVTA